VVFVYTKAVSATGEASDYCSGKARTCDLAQPVVTESNDSGTGHVTLEWEKIDGAAKYKIYRRVGKTGDYEYYTSTTKTSYTDKDTEAGTVYYYKVKAAHSNSSADSAKSAGVGQTCKLPRPDVSVTTSSGKPKLTWGAVEGASKYEIYRATAKSGTYSLVKTTTGKSFTDKNVTAGTTYYYKVKAIHSNSSATSAYSSIDSIQSK
jgi:lactocepin